MTQHGNDGVSSPPAGNATQVAHRESAQAASNRRALAAIGGGNVLEWYDWAIYGLLAPLLAVHIFPAADPASSVLAALAVFGAGFVARPIGAVVLGTAADKLGRRGVMLLTVALMTLASLAIGILPGYETIGGAAGVLLLVARLMQGFSAGIEGPLSYTYAIEIAPSGKQAWFTGITVALMQVGTLLASAVPYAVGLLLGDDALRSWAWRIPFLVGGAMGLVILYMRRTLPEQHAQQAGEEAREVTVAGVWGAVFSNKIGLVAIIFAAAGAQAFNYAFTVGLPAVAQSTYGESPSRVFAATTAVALLILVLTLGVGRVADTAGPGRLYLWFRGLSLPAVLLMLLYSGDYQTFLLVMISGGLVLALNMAIVSVVMAELMPRRCRVSGVGLGNAIGVTVFGGTAPYILTWMSANGAYAFFPAYLFVLCLVGLGTYVAARSRGRLFEY